MNGEAIVKSVAVGVDQQGNVLLRPMTKAEEDEENLQKEEAGLKAQKPGRLKFDQHLMKFYCKLCGLYFPSANRLEQHNNTEAHLEREIRAENSRGVDIDEAFNTGEGPTPPPPPPVANKVDKKSHAKKPGSHGRNNLRHFHDEIRKKYESGTPLEQLCEEYGTGKGTIGYILSKPPSLMKKGRGGAQPFSKVPRGRPLASPNNDGSIQVVKLSTLGIFGYKSSALAMLQKFSAIDEDEAVIKKCKNAHELEEIRKALYVELRKQKFDIKTLTITTKGLMVLLFKSKM